MSHAVAMWGESLSPTASSFPLYSSLADGLRRVNCPVIKGFPPMLIDVKKKRYWVRCAAMAITHLQVQQPSRDDQEKYYEQKYHLTVPWKMMTRTFKTCQNLSGWSSVPGKACVILTLMPCLACIVLHPKDSILSPCVNLLKCTISTLRTKPTHPFSPFYWLAWATGKDLRPTLWEPRFRPAWALWSPINLPSPWQTTQPPSWNRNAGPMTGLPAVQTGIHINAAIIGPTGMGKSCLLNGDDEVMWTSSCQTCSK